MNKSRKVQSHSVVGIPNDERIPQTPFTISTPFRQLRTPLTTVTETPFMIKYPLLAYLDSHFCKGDLEIKMQARRINSHATQQTMISKIDNLHQICPPNMKHNDPLLNELRRQYILAVLHEQEDADAILRTLQHLSKSSQGLSGAAMKPIADAENTMPKQQTPKPSPICDTADNITATTTDDSVRQSTPAQTTKVPTPQTGTPATPTPIGQTPLNVMKRNHMNRLRITAMNQKIAKEPENIQMAVRKRLSCIAEETTEELGLESAMNRVVYSAKRSSVMMIQTPSKKQRTQSDCVYSESPCNSTRSDALQASIRDAFSVAVAIGNTPEIQDVDVLSVGRSANAPGSTPHPDVPLALRRGRRACANAVKYTPNGVVPRARPHLQELPAILSIVSESAESEIFSEPEEEATTESPEVSKRHTIAASQPEPSSETHRMDTFQISKRNSVASMFTSRGAPQKGNKFQSRTSLTAKLKRTRERRQMRQNWENLASNSETMKQAGTRMRKLERYEKLSEAKYVAYSTFDDLAELQQRLSSEERSELKRRMCETDKNTKWETLLHSVYKYDTFRSHQLESLRYLDATEDAALLLSLPTGAGKSLVYLLCGVNRSIGHDELCVMILPTKSLVADQYAIAQRLLGATCNVVKLHSGLETKDYATIFRGLKAGFIDFLFTTPEQFVTSSLTSLLSTSPRTLGLVCVDEAHCLSEWSHTFRPAYQSVLEIVNHFHKKARLLMMTATIALDTQKYIVEGAKALRAVRHVEVIKLEHGYWRSDICLKVRASESLIDAFVATYHSERRDAGGTHLVFVWMKHQAEFLVRQLKERGVAEKVYFYHSGISDLEKGKLAELLERGKVDILVSTQALGLGLDVKNITNVHHLSIPSSIEQWLQEVGRCNRDGRSAKANCYGFADFKEYWKRRQKTAASRIDDTAVKQVLVKLLEKDATSEVTSVGSVKEMRFALNSRSLRRHAVKWYGPEYDLVVMDAESARIQMNCFGEDELYVISSIIERSCLERVIAGTNDFGWWILSDLEFRCFDKDLDSLGEGGGMLTRLRETIWEDKPNQGVYKLRWSELLMRNSGVDPMKIRDGIYSACQLNRVSVRPANNTRRVYVRLAGGQSNLVGTLMERVTQSMFRSNSAQVRKQEMARIAWKVAEECGEDELRKLMSLYFEGQLTWPFEGPNAHRWLYDSYGQFIEDDVGALAVFKNDLEMLRECLESVDENALTTPVACARILCGVHATAKSVEAWRGRYERVPFEIVLKLAS